MIKKGTATVNPEGYSKVYRGTTLVYEAVKHNYAPASTTCLYHFDNSLKNEVTGNNMSGSGTITYVTGKFDKAYESNQNYKTEVINLSLTDLLTKDYTLEFWWKTTLANRTYLSDGFDRFVDSSSRQPFFSTENIKTAGLKMNTSASAGVYPFAQNCIVDNIQSNFNNLNWNHCAVVITGGTYQVYLNGQKASHGNVRNDSTNKFYNFRFPTSWYIFDEFLFCNSAKYTTDFTPPDMPYELAP